MPRKNNPLPIEEVRTGHRLKSAWREVYSNGSKSDSVDTRREVEKFKEKEDTNLKAIANKLRTRIFQFEPAKAITVKKPGKKEPRPIVLANVEARIVQRSILDVLQSKTAIKKYLEVPTSFGAIRGKGVPDAIKIAVEAIKGGATYYIKSDIQSFFTKIPLPVVINTIRESINDDEFIHLLERATKLEVANIKQIKKEYRHYFNFNEVGTPQGCCLSPLMGNILLHKFDNSMNDGDIKCLRYLDDFIILAPNERAAHAALKRALGLLSEYNLSAYDPKTDTKKASAGHVNSKFEFLGVEFDKRTLRPSPANCNKIIAGIESILQESMAVNFAEVENFSKEEFSMVKTFLRVHNKLKGWGNQYFFCNDIRFWGSMDKLIDEKIMLYRKQYIKKLQHLEALPEEGWKKKRRQLGIHLLVDSNSKPISWE